MQLLSAKMPPIPPFPLENSNLNLDISGVAGFFGGDVAVKAMSTVHVYAGLRWLGWYNSPGSYEVAKQYGQLARSRFWDGLYPGPNLDPAELFELDDEKGPSYSDIHSGTTMRKTGHLAHLFAHACKHVKTAKEFSEFQKAYRTTTPVDVTVAYLHHEPEPKVHPPALNETATRAKSGLLAHIPILASLTTCILCALYADWICFSMILVGMLSNGISCAWVGSAKLTFTHPTPAAGSPPGCGILNDGNHIIILKGREGAVNSITRGKFSLDYECSEHYHRIGLSSLFLTAQFLAQLLLLPQGQKFGQIMFLTSLAVSWMYNSYLASLDSSAVQRKIFVKGILQDPVMMKYTLGTRTTMAVFVLLVLAGPESAQRVQEGGDAPPVPDPEKLKRMLDDLLPNDTPVWRAWKASVLDKVARFRRGATREQLRVASMDADLLLSPEERTLQETLDGDATAAFHAYGFYRGHLPQSHEGSHR